MVERRFERLFEMTVAFEEDGSSYPPELDQTDVAYAEIEDALDELRAMMRLWVDVALLPGVDEAKGT